MKHLNILNKNTCFFLLATLISGGGWILVPTQIESISPLFSIAYRFMLAGIILLSIALIRREKLFDRKIINLLLLQACLMFPLHYLFTYMACAYIPSGLVGLIASLTVIPTLIFGLIFKKETLSPRILLHLTLSVAGLLILFREDIFAYNTDTLGLIFALLSIIFSALALYIIPRINRRTHLSMLSLTGQSMILGGIMSLTLGIVYVGDIQFSFETDFLLGLVILSLLTPIVFLIFYHFSANLSPLYASYIWSVSPVVAIIMSLTFEGYTPNYFDIFAIVLILVSCILVNINMKSPEGR